MANESDDGGLSIGLSGLLTSSREAMQQALDLLRRVAAEIGKVIVIGGGLIDEQVRRCAGADSFVTDAMGGAWLRQRPVPR